MENETGSSELEQELIVQPWRIMRRTTNPPAITNETEEIRIAPVTSFAGFRVGANKRVKKLSLKTPLYPDHTYNGVSFNINGKKNSTNWIFVTGFEASGRLGVMRIFKLWGKNVNDHSNDPHLWEEIHRKKYEFSWRKFQVLALDEPVRIGPGETCGFYIHSDCSDNDLGLKYRSCLPGVVLEDNNVTVTHGWAHTSSIPFDQERGWIRKNRVLSGNIFYEATPLRWSPDRNFFWTKSQKFQDALKCITKNKFFPPGVRIELMTFCSMDWFNEPVCTIQNMSMRQCVQNLVGHTVANFFQSCDRLASSTSDTTERNALRRSRSLDNSEESGDKKRSRLEYYSPSSSSEEKSPIWSSDSSGDI